MNLWQRFQRRPAAMAGLSVTALVLAAAVAAPLLTPHDPLDRKSVV